MLITAIVGTYNRCRSLQDTLTALKGQRLAEGNELEIVVMDNNSTDQTPGVVQAVSGQPGWPVRYVREDRQGISFARNRGIAEAQGAFIVSTDDDTLPAENWVQELVGGLQAHQGDCGGGKVLPLWLSEPPEWMYEVRLREAVWNTLGMLDRGNRPLVASPAHWNFPYGANIGFRKDLFREIGLFRTDLGAVGRGLARGEDTEFFGRAGRAGKRVLYVPSAIVHHKVENNRMTLQYFRRWKFNSGRSVEHLSPTPQTRMPAWLIRECLGSGGRAMGRYLGRDRIGAIEQELIFWSALGRCMGILDHRGSKGPGGDAVINGRRG